MKPIGLDKAMKNLIRDLRAGGVLTGEDASIGRLRRNLQDYSDKNNLGVNLYDNDQFNSFTEYVRGKVDAGYTGVSHSDQTNPFEKLMAYNNLGEKLYKNTAFARGTRELEKNIGSLTQTSQDIVKARFNARQKAGGQTISDNVNVAIDPHSGDLGIFEEYEEALSSPTTRSYNDAKTLKQFRTNNNITFDQQQAIKKELAEKVAAATPPPMSVQEAIAYGKSDYYKRLGGTPNQQLPDFKAQREMEEAQQREYNAGNAVQESLKQSLQKVQQERIEAGLKPLSKKEQKGYLSAIRNAKLPLDSEEFKNLRYSELVDKAAKAERKKIEAKLSPEFKEDARYQRFKEQDEKIAEQKRIEALEQEQRNKALDAKMTAYGKKATSSEEYTTLDKEIDGGLQSLFTVDNNSQYGIGTTVNTKKANSIAKSKAKYAGGNNATDYMINDANKIYQDELNIANTTKGLSHDERAKMIVDAQMKYAQRINNGPQFTDYIFGNKIHTGAIGAAALTATYGVAFGGSKSNAELYGSPF